MQRSSLAISGSEGRLLVGRKKPLGASPTIECRFAKLVLHESGFCREAFSRFNVKRLAPIVGEICSIHTEKMQDYNHHNNDADNVKDRFIHDRTLVF